MKNKTIILVECSDRAHRLQSELDPAKEKYIVAALGWGVHGYRADLIIVSHAAHVMMNNPDISSPLKVALYQHWYRDAVLTRLTREGKVIHI